MNRRERRPSIAWSWHLGRIAGIDIYLHGTFVLLLAWLGWVYWRQGGPVAALHGLTLILLLFACVTLHELGHALTARRFGITTRDIVLLPIGGVASMERMPDDPRQEILVALAGPAVNLLIAAALWLALTLSGGDYWADIGLLRGNLLQNLLILNLFLAVFNLLPAFPMDGGRVLRAGLSLWMDRPRATRAAATIGQLLALWLGFLGLMYNPFLALIALFVWVGAAAEAGSEEARSLLHDIPLRHAMITRFETLAPDDPLARAVALTLETTQKDFPVVERGRLVGVLTQHALLRGLREAGEEAPVGRFVDTEVERATPDEPMDAVLDRLQHCGCRVLPVMEDDHLLGLVDLDNLMELIRIENALRDRQ